MSLRKPAPKKLGKSRKSTKGPSIKVTEEKDEGKTQAINHKACQEQLLRESIVLEWRLCQMQAENAELTSRLVQADETISQLKDTTVKADETISDLENQVQELKNRAENETQEVEGLKTVQSELEDANRLLEDELESLRNAVEGSNAASGDEIRQLADENEELKQQNSRLQRELEDALSHMDSEKKDLHEQSQNAIKSLEDELARMRDDKSAVEKELETLTLEFTRSENVVEELKLSDEKHLATTSELEQQIESLKSEVVKLKQMTNLKESELQQHSEDTLRNLQQKHEETVRTLQQKLELQQAQIESSITNTEVHQTSKKEFEVKIRQLEDDSSRLQHQLETQQRDMEEQESKLSELRKKLRETEDNNSSLRAEVERLQKDVKRRVDECQDLEDANAELRKECRKLRNENEISSTPSTPINVDASTDSALAQKLRIRLDKEVDRSLELQDKIVELRHELARVKDELAEERVKAAHAKSEMAEELLRSTSMKPDQRLVDATREAAAAKQELDMANARLSELERALKMRQFGDPLAEQNLREEVHKLKVLNARLEERVKQLGLVEMENGALQEEVIALKKKLARLEILIEKETALAALRELSESDLKHQSDSALLKRINVLQRQIELLENDMEETSETSVKLRQELLQQQRLTAEAESCNRLLQQQALTSMSASSPSSATSPKFIWNADKQQQERDKLQRMSKQLDQVRQQRDDAISKASELESQLEDAHSKLKQLSQYSDMFKANNQNDDDDIDDDIDDRTDSKDHELSKSSTSSRSNRPLQRSNLVDENDDESARNDDSLNKPLASTSDTAPLSVRAQKRVLRTLPVLKAKKGSSSPIVQGVETGSNGEAIPLTDRVDIQQMNADEMEQVLANLEQQGRELELYKDLNSQLLDENKKAKRNLLQKQAALKSSEADSTSMSALQDDLEAEKLKNQRLEKAFGYVDPESLTMNEETDCQDPIQLRKVIADLRRQLATTTAALDTTNHDLRKLKESSQVQNLRHSDEIVRLESDLSYQKDKAQELQYIVNGLEEVSPNSSNSDELTRNRLLRQKALNKCDDLQAKNANLDKENQKLNFANEDLQSRVADIEAELESNNDLKDMIDEAAKNDPDLQLQLQSLSTQVKDLKGQNASLHQRLAALASDRNSRTRKVLDDLETESPLLSATSLQLRGRRDEKHPLVSSSQRVDDDDDDDQSLKSKQDFDFDISHLVDDPLVQTSSSSSSSLMRPGQVEPENDSNSSNARSQKGNDADIIQDLERQLQELELQHEQDKAIVDEANQRSNRLAKRLRSAEAQVNSGPDETSNSSDSFEPSGTSTSAINTHNPSFGSSNGHQKDENDDNKFGSSHGKSSTSPDSSSKFASSANSDPYSKIHPDKETFRELQADRDELEARVSELERALHEAHRRHAPYAASHMETSGTPFGQQHGLAGNDDLAKDGVEDASSHLKETSLDDDEEANDSAQAGQREGNLSISNPNHSSKVSSNSRPLASTDKSGYDPDFMSRSRPNSSRGKTLEPSPFVNWKSKDSSDKSDPDPLETSRLLCQRAHKLADDMKAAQDLDADQQRDSSMSNQDFDDHDVVNEDTSDDNQTNPHDNNSKKPRKDQMKDLSHQSYQVAELADAVDEQQKMLGKAMQNLQDENDDLQRQLQDALDELDRKNNHEKIMKDADDALNNLHDQNAQQLAANQKRQNRELQALRQALKNAELDKEKDMKNNDDLLKRIQELEHENERLRKALAKLLGISPDEISDDIIDDILNDEYGSSATPLDSRDRRMSAVQYKKRSFDQAMGPESRPGTATRMSFDAQMDHPDAFSKSTIDDIPEVEEEFFFEGELESKPFDYKDRSQRQGGVTDILLGRSDPHQSSERKNKRPSLSQYAADGNEDEDGDVHSNLREMEGPGRRPKRQSDSNIGRRSTILGPPSRYSIDEDADNAAGTEDWQPLSQSHSSNAQSKGPDHPEDSRVGRRSTLLGPDASARFGGDDELSPDSKSLDPLSEQPVSRSRTQNNGEFPGINGIDDDLNGGPQSKYPQNSRSSGNDDDDDDNGFGFDAPDKDDDQIDDESEDTPNYPHKALVLYDHDLNDKGPDHEAPYIPHERELPLLKGDVVTVLEPPRRDGLCEANAGGRQGLVPHAFLRPLTHPEERPHSRIVSRLGNDSLRSHPSSDSSRPLKVQNLDSPIESTAPFTPKGKTPLKPPKPFQARFPFDPKKYPDKIDNPLPLKRGDVVYVDPDEKPQPDGFIKVQAPDGDEGVVPQTFLMPVGSLDSPSTPISKPLQEVLGGSLRPPENIQKPSSPAIATPVKLETLSDDTTSLRSTSSQQGNPGRIHRSALDRPSVANEKVSRKGVKGLFKGKTKSYRL